MYVVIIVSGYLYFVCWTLAKSSTKIGAGFVPAPSYSIWIVMGVLDAKYKK